MSVIKQLRFKSTTAQIAQTNVEALNNSAITVTSEHTALEDNNDPVYTIGLAVDGKTITQTTQNGLSTTLKLKYHAAVTTEGSEKEAYIALEDNTGASVAESEINISDIIGSAVLKGASYNENTGILTLTFATNETIDVDLTNLLDINDIIIKKDGSEDYLVFDIVDPKAEESQSTLGVKLADVTYTQGTTSTDADLSVSTTNGKMLDATDAIPAIKNYVDDVTGKVASLVENLDVAGSVLEGYTKETDVKGDIVSTDTIKQAFNKIENNIEANELVTSASLNELNTRIEEINAKLTQINNTIASLQQAQGN